MNGHNGNPSSSRRDVLSRSTATKRDSLAAELEKDPQLSTAKRQQRTQAFTSTMAHSALERQVASIQTAKMELETKLREKDTYIERLERDRRWFSDREAEEKEEKEKERAEHEESKKKSDAELKTLRSTLASLREAHADLEDAHSSLSRTTAQTIASQKSQVATLSRQTTLLEDELSQSKRLAEERFLNLQQLQERFDDLGAAQDTLIRRGAEEENMAVVREELHRQANYLRTLESTNTKLTSELASLRERHTSLEVLREEKRGLERKVRGLEEMRERVVKLEAEVDAGRREREDWANKSMESATPSQTPVSVTQSLLELRLTHARLLEEHGASMALLRQREAELADAQSQATEAQETIESLEVDVRALQEKAARHDQLTSQAEREVSFLQALVASFTAEEAVRDGVSIDEVHTQRITQLETLLQEYKSTISQLTDEIDALGGDPSALGHGKSRQELAEEAEKARLEKAEVQKVLEATESESKIHLDKIEELEQTLFELSGEIAGGRHVPPGVRVLSLKDNPEQQWVDLRQAAMDRLREENEALLRRLKELEESGARGAGLGQDGEGGEGHGEELVPRASWELANKEKEDLEETVKQKEKRLLRLQQVYQSKSAEFREAIAAILGVKIAFYPNGQVRVTSLFDLNASFVFQPGPSNQGAKMMSLVAQGEGGPEDLPNMMQYWIANEQCIPGFVASVTLECYETSKREARR